MGWIIGSLSRREHLRGGVKYFVPSPSSSILSGGQGHGGHGHPLNEKFSHSLIRKVDVIIRKRKRILGNIELRNVSNLQTCQQNFCVNTAENKNIVKYKNGQFHHLY